MDAKSIIARYNKLKSERATWDSVWQDVSNYLSPRKSNIQEYKTPSSHSYTGNLFDTTAIRSNFALAAGQLNFLTPVSDRWCAFESPFGEDGLVSEAVKRFYNLATNQVLTTLAKSNFYQHIHECYLDRGSFGTTLMFCGEDEFGDIFFKNYRVGSFILDQDHKGNIDTVMREFSLTNRQAAQKFGEQNLSDSAREELRQPSAAGLDMHRTYIHAVFPASDKKTDKNKANKPILSYYIDIKDKKIISEGGYDEMPYFASRYLLFSDDETYGYSPAIEVLPEVKSLNQIEKVLDVLAEIQVEPRILCPDSIHPEELNLAPGGVTSFSAADPNDIPREWATQGRYDVGLNRAEHKRKTIEDAFHVNLFQMLTNREKTMTATEVEELVNEKLIQFTPTFSRMIDEFLSPLLKRVFSILWRNGRLGQIPEELLVSDGDKVSMLEPKLSFNSRIGLAIKAMQSNVTNRYVQTIMNLSQVDPSVIDKIDFDKVAELSAEAFGVPNDVLRDSDTVEALRARRAEQEQMQQAAMMASEGADALAKSGDVGKQLLKNIRN